ncbi:MAG: mucoidy inhibitor MuiA family protein [Hyphomicrobiaceae bacterium]
MRGFLAAGLMLVCFAGPVAAADIPAPSELDAVTVFPQGAEVTRIARVKIEAGSHVVIVRDLPSGLVADSIRVQGEATGALELGAVDSRVFYLSELDNAQFNQSERKRLEDELQKLYDRQNALNDEINAAEQQRQLIANLAQLPARPDPEKASARTIEEWNGIFALIGDKLGDINRRNQASRLALRDIDKQIAELQNQLNRQPGREEERTEVKINVSADQPLEATLRIRYQVPAAAWAPLYDARLDTGDQKEEPKLTLVRRAVVSQGSGEDWTNVALTLSTTRPGSGTAAPEISSLIVDYLPDPIALAKKKRNEAKSDQPAGGVLSMDAAPAMEDAQSTLEYAAAPAPVEARDQYAAVIDTGFQAIYVIADRQTVKTGEGQKRVQIDVKSFAPVLSMRTVPKFSDVAYLYAKLTLESGLVLLPGQTSLFRDGVFVGRGDLPQLAGGEEHELGFGADDKVRVKFTTLDRSTGETGIISASSVETQRFKTTVKNFHERAVTVMVYDQMPVSANEEIQVSLTSGSTPATAQNVEDKRGVVSWELKLDPDQEAEINFGYQVSWPKEKRIQYYPQ